MLLGHNPLAHVRGSHRMTSHTHTHTHTKTDRRMHAHAHWNVAEIVFSSV